MNAGKELSYRERWGVAAALQTALLHRLRRWLGLRVYGVYSHPLTLSSAEGPVVPGYSARLFVAGDPDAADALIACTRSRALGLSEQFVRAALEKGDVCLGIFHEGAVVSYTWCAFTPTHDDEGVFVRFGGKCGYAYKSFTLPEHRGQHLLRIFIPVRDRYGMAAHGCTHTVAFVDLHNRASIRHTLAVGHRRIGTAGYLKRGRFFWPFSTAGARQYGFHFFLPRE